jgi:hypothetical protein
MDNGQTAQSEILQSLRAIQVAAAERRSALLAEVAELEAAFPTLVKAERRTGSRAWSAESRQRMSDAMRQRWATARANGTAAVQ